MRREEIEDRAVKAQLPRLAPAEVIFPPAAAITAALEEVPRPPSTEVSGSPVVGSSLVYISVNKDP